MCRNLFDQPRNYFLQKFEKVTKCHKIANAILRQPRIQGSRACHAQKSRGFRVVQSKKLFRENIFCFLANSIVRYAFELLAHETNLKKNRSVLLLLLLATTGTGCLVALGSNREPRVQQVQGSAKNAGHDGRFKVSRKVIRLQIVFLEIFSPKIHL